MKRTLAFALGATVMAMTLHAGDAASIIKQKAKDVANSPPPGQAPPPTQSAPAKTPAPVVVRVQPAKPKVDLVAKQQMDQIMAALNAIQPDTKATAEQQQRLNTALTSASRGSRTPSAGAVANLTADLAAAWPYQKMSAREREHLANDLHAVLNAGSKPASETQASLNSSQLVLKYSGLDMGKAQKISDDLKAIASELQKK